jgi:hypothetical protein
MVSCFHEPERRLTLSVIATLPLVLLSSTTTLLHGRLSGAMKGKSGERKSPMTFSIVTLAGAMSTAGVMGLWAGVSPTLPIWTEC